MQLVSRGRPARRAGWKISALVLLAAALTLSLAPQPRAQDADPVVARVNGVEIRQSDLTILEEEVGANIPPQMPPEARHDYLITLLADTLLVAHEAQGKGLADGADFKRRLAFAHNRLLSEVLLQQEAKAALTEEAMRKVYEDAAKQIGAEQEVRARHILFRVEDDKDEKAGKEAEAKAKAVLARLKKGEDFAKLAGELTEDPSGKENGGDLGYFTRDQMVPEFAEVAFKLDAGKMSDPVKTQFGWHILKVEDKRNRPVPEFDKVKDQIESFLTRKAQSDLVTRLRAAAKIERVPPAPTR